MTLKQEQREVLDTALSIGSARVRERSRHSNANEKLMARAAENCYAAHLVNMIDSTGYAPAHSGAQGRAEARKAAQEGLVLTAGAYAQVIGFSESYVSRLYRLGFGMAAGILDPDEESDDGPTLWQVLSRTLGDTPEVGRVLGKEVDTLPTLEAVQEAVAAAKERKARERDIERQAAAAMPEVPIPTRPSEQIDLLQDLVGTLSGGRHLTARQIDRVRATMDELREMVEAWVHVEAGDGDSGVPEARAS